MYGRRTEVDVRRRYREKKSVPSDLPPCPTAASKLCGLAVEPILDILSDRL
jgi:hypothetical protein